MNTNNTAVGQLLGVSKYAITRIRKSKDILLHQEKMQCLLQELVRFIFVIIAFLFHFSPKYPKIPEKLIVILTKSTFWSSQKRQVFLTFSEMSRSDVGFTDIGSVTA